MSFAAPSTACRTLSSVRQQPARLQKRPMLLRRACWASGMLKPRGGLRMWRRRPRLPHCEHWWVAGRHTNWSLPCLAVAARDLGDGVLSGHDLHWGSQLAWLPCILHQPPVCGMCSVCSNWRSSWRQLGRSWMHCDSSKPSQPCCSSYRPCVAS